MIDFLTFKTFISIDILILSYYIGAVIIPISMWLGKSYLQRKFKILDKFNIFLITLFLFLTFISMEIVWRMCFEAMIGYFQMVEATKLLL